MIYKEYRDEIPLNTLIKWSDIIMENADWKHVGWTGNPREPLRHWAAYPELTGVLKQLWDFIDDSIKEDGLHLIPKRIVLNLYNHGDSSWLHKDSDSNTDYTVIVFMNQRWDILWGGDFVLVENNELIQSFAATPGKFVVFKSNILHAARPVSREAPYPRFGLAFQCELDKYEENKNPSRIRATTI